MVCIVCEGTGKVDMLCSHCGGSGEGMTSGSRCYICKGRAVVYQECEECNGTGVATEYEEVDA